MKNNFDHLRDLIKGNQEAVEFLDAIISDFAALQKYNSKLTKDVEKLNSDLKEAEEEITLYENQCINSDDLVSIDCGIGTIKYLEPDNLKLRMEMEEFAERKSNNYMFH